MCPNHKNMKYTCNVCSSCYEIVVHIGFVICIKQRCDGSDHYIRIILSFPSSAKYTYFKNTMFQLRCKTETQTPNTYLWILIMYIHPIISIKDQWNLRHNVVSKATLLSYMLLTLGGMESRLQFYLSLYVSEHCWL